MKFVCDNCNTKYSIADDKVRRKVLKIRCKNCSHIIVVRDPKRSTQHRRRKSTGAKALDQAFDRSFEDSASLRMTGGRQAIQAVQSQAAALAQHRGEPEEMPTMLSQPGELRDAEGDQHDEWYLAVDGHQFGPMSFDELCKRVKRGEARGDSGEEAFVWHDGFDDWLEVTSVPELRPYVPPPPPPRGRSGLFPVASDPAGLPPMPVDLTPPPRPRAPTRSREAAAAVVAAPAMPPAGAPAMPPAGAPAMPPAGAPAQAQQLAAGADSALIGAPDAAAAAALASADIAAAPVTMPPPAAAPMPWSMRLALVGALLSAVMGVVMIVYVFTREQAPAPSVVAQRAVQPTTDDLVATAGQGEAGGEAPVAVENPAAPMEFPAIEVRHGDGRKAAARKARPARPGASATADDDGLTAEQRAMLKRFGQDVEVDVPQQKKKAKVRRGRNITQAEVQQLQMRNKRYIQSCYNRALKRDYSLKDSRADVTLVVGTSGRVNRVRFKGITSQALSSCLQSNLKRWVFRPLGGTDAGAVKFSLLFRGS